MTRSSPLFYLTAILSWLVMLTHSFTPLWQTPFSTTGHGQLNMTKPSSDEAGKAYIEGLHKIYLKNTIEALLKNGTEECNIHNIHIRRAWDDMTESQRANYIQAAKCVSRIPSETDRSLAPGVRNAIDDFVWAHVEQTNYVHGSGLLLPFHRQFIWAWEKLLYDQCNFTGPYPYWDWSRHAYNQSQSPVFESGPNSFGGDGEYIPHGTLIQEFIELPVPLQFARDPGLGGGCVTDGAFGNNTGYTLNIGLVTPVNSSFGGHNTLYPNNTFGQQYNPRCLRRDFLQAESTELLNYTAVAILMQQDSIYNFLNTFESGRAVHLAGHFFLGIDGSDIYSSPNEPVFWLHHAQLDRLWAIWQAQDFAGRGEALAGTVTVSNIPPSDNATLDTIMHMGNRAGGDLAVRKAMSPIANGHCYLYL